MKTDRLTVQMVVAFIGTATLLTIVGLIALSFAGRAVPEPLTALGGAAIGALSSLLARTATEGHSLEEAPAPEPLAPIEPEDRPPDDPPAPKALPLQAASPQATSPQAASPQATSPQATS